MQGSAAHDVDKAVATQVFRIHLLHVVDDVIDSQVVLNNSRNFEKATGFISSSSSYLASLSLGAAAVS